MRIVWDKWESGISVPLPARGNPYKNDPISKKLLAAGSVEEEALVLLIQEKKIAEQEKELMALLNFRFGYGTWDELKEMRPRLQSKEKKKFMSPSRIKKKYD